MANTRDTTDAVTMACGQLPEGKGSCLWHKFCLAQCCMHSGPPRWPHRVQSTLRGQGTWSPTSAGQAAPNKLSRSVIIIISFLLFLVGWVWVHSVRRPLLAYCTSPRRYMMVIVEQLVGWRLAGETEVLREKLPQRHFVHHISNMSRPGLEPGPPRWEASD
jgi:hypothetical protein